MNATRIVPVIVVVQPRVLLLDVAGPIEVLRKVNLEQSAVRFDVSFVGPQAQCNSSIGLAVSGVLPLPDRIPDDAIVMISGTADIPLGAVPPVEPDQQADKSIIAWLQRVVRPGIRLVSICSGALLAARAGLLDGYRCTTHHASVEELARLAPASEVLTNRLFVEDRERLTSAGITAGIDLMLHLVSGLVGPGCAVAVARYMVVYMRRGGGDPQLSPWLEGRNHIHPIIHRLQDAIVADPARDWSVSELSRQAAASPRNLSRLFNEHAGMSVTEYVNRLRVTLAAEMLNSSRLDIETIAERSGFGSPRQMRRVWGRYHALPPSQARQ